jgi:quercetin dioxygenase-like cupin family protein
MRRIITGVNSSGRSYVISAEDLSGPETGDWTVWESDAELTRSWAQAIDEVPPSIEPEVGASKVIIGQSSGDAPPGPWHATRTVDFYYLIEGEVTLELDDDVVEVRAGDLVIQQATRHRWIPHEGVPRQFLVVLSRL